MGDIFGKELPAMSSNLFGTLMHSAIDYLNKGEKQVILENIVNSISKVIMLSKDETYLI